MLALRRNKSKPKKIYKDSSSLQAQYMRERELLKIEENRRKFEERRRRGEEPEYIEKTKEELVVEHQKAFEHYIRSKLYRKKAKNFRHLASLDRKGLMELWAYYPRYELKSNYIPKEEIIERYTGLQTIRGYTHLRRGDWKTPILSRGRGQGKQHFIFGEIKYLKNVKERFWSLLLRNNTTEFAQTLKTCKDFMNQVLLGTHPEINYIHKFNDFLYWILKSNFTLIVIKEFIEIILKTQAFIMLLFNNNNGLVFNKNEIIINYTFFMKSKNIIPCENIIEYKKQVYISHIILKLIYSLNINLFSCLKKEKTEKTSLLYQYNLFLVKMSNWNVPKTIPGHYVALFLNSNVMNTQYFKINESSPKNTQIIKPEIVFLFNYSGFFTKECIDPVNIPSLSRFFFNFSTFNSIKEKLSFIFNTKFNLNNKYISMSDSGIQNIIASSAIKYFKYYKSSSSLHNKKKQIQLFQNVTFTMFFSYYFYNYDNLRLRSSQFINLYTPIVYESVWLALDSKSSILKLFFTFIKKKYPRFLMHFKGYILQYINIVYDISNTLTIQNLNKLHQFVAFVIEWIKRHYVILFNLYLVGKDIFFPFIVPSRHQVQTSGTPVNLVYSGTRRKLSGMYTESIRQLYKKENTLILRQLIRAITTGGGRSRSVSILYKMLKKFKSMHDNYDLSAILALERCVNFCSPRLRVRKFIKGTSKIYKFMPMRFSRRIGTGVHNFVGASFMRTTFRKMHKKFFLVLAEELASIFIGIMTEAWTPPERYSLKYTSGVAMDAITDDLIPPAYDIVRENRQMLTYLRYYPTRIRGHVLINSPYLEFINRKKEDLEDELEK